MSDRPEYFNPNSTTGELMTRILNRKGTSKRTARDLLTYYRAARKWGMVLRQAKVFATYFIDATNSNIIGGLWSAWCQYCEGRSNGRRAVMNGFMLRYAKRRYTIARTSIGWRFCNYINSGYYLDISPAAPTDRDCERIECFNRHVAPALKPLYKRAELSLDAPLQILADALIDANDEQGTNVVRSLFE